jgi:hypothetical protein
MFLELTSVYPAIAVAPAAAPRDETRKFSAIVGFLVYKGDMKLTKSGAAP